MSKTILKPTLFPFLISPNDFNGNIVNVASIPQRSVFRYPGGKTWFVPTFRKWIASKHKVSKTLFEPFTGGGIIGLTTAFENLADKVVLAEIDESIASVWQTVLSRDAEWLTQRILDFDLTRKTLLKELDRKRVLTKELAFQTILRNRTFHGGILANGSSLMKTGENGKGLLSRWYPSTLAKRILSIASIIDRIEFIHGDGIKLIQENLKDKGSLFFIDPPYTIGGKKAGRRLYTHSELDHLKLFELCKEIKGDFIMTYDNSTEVRFLANKFGFESKPISMRNTHNTEMTELIIGKDLSWLKTN